jgi:predicted enzyme related to lactoylglutathione lyase
MKRVTGIGGIFFKSENPQMMKDWYNKHLGVETDEWGGVFHWRSQDDPAKNNTTVWSPFPKDTKYFSPSRKSYMFNYIVENLAELLPILKEEGVKVVGEIQEFEYGKFAWIIDPEGNKIELWEPFGQK